MSNRNVYCDDSPVALNAPPPYDAEAWAVPVVLIGCGALAAFEQAHGGSAPSTLDALAVAAASKATSAASRNVVGTLRIPHADDAKHPEGTNTSARARCHTRRFIVSTPISGWFHCGGERGPGVAIFLGLAEALPRLAAARCARRSAHNAAACGGVELLFVGTSGHELGDMGAELNLASLAARGWGVDSGVDAFVSLGASIITWQNITGAGATPDGVYRSPLCYNTERLGDALVTPFSAAGYAPGLNRSDLAGELLKVIGAGYAAFGFYGNFYRFHTPEDDASSTSAELLETVGKATLAALEALLE